jgi:hypothetical protein
MTRWPLAIVGQRRQWHHCRRAMPEFAALGPAPLRQRARDQVFLVAPG